MASTAVNAGAGGGLSLRVKLVYVVLIANALPAFALLTFLLEERAHGARRPVLRPLGVVPRVVATLGALGFGALGVVLLIDPLSVNHIWPWALTPLVGRILGVWCCSLAVSYAWALA